MKLWTCLAAALVMGLAAPVAASARDDHGRDQRAPEAHRGDAPRGGPPQFGERREPQGYAPPQRAPGYGYNPNYRSLPAPYYPARRPAYPNYPAYPGAYPGYRPPAYVAPRYGGPRYGEQQGYGRWRRGQILPPAYRGEVVNDYGRYHLRRPPRGYYWCRQGDDFVLVAMTTGLIFEVITGGY